MVKKNKAKPKSAKYIFINGGVMSGVGKGIASSSIGKILQSKGFKISHLGKGLSTGTELEYSDTDTIKNALKNRN